MSSVCASHCSPSCPYHDAIQSIEHLKWVVDSVIAKDPSLLKSFTRSSGRYRTVISYSECLMSESGKWRRQMLKTKSTLSKQDQKQHEHSRLYALAMCKHINAALRRAWAR